jgi:hypothetical protein
MFPPQVTIALTELRIQDRRDHAAATRAVRRRRTGRVGTVRRWSIGTILRVSGEPGHLPG